MSLLGRGSLCVRAIAMLDVTQLPDSASNLASARVAAAGRTAVRPADFGKGKIALIFVVLLAIVAIPILLNPLPPISDYINHLARMHIIATIGSDPDLHRYYEVDWQLIPNLMMDLIVPLFVRVVNVYVAGQIYTLMSFVLIVSGTMALHRQLFGRWSALPLIAFPLLYNDVFLVGTMNYVFGIGLMLWALAAWVALRERSLALRLSVSTLFVLGLFFCHLFVLGVYGLGLLAFESHRLLTTFIAMRRSSGRDAARRALPSLVADFVATGVPFLVVPLLLMISPTRGLWDFYWRMEGKGDGLLFVIRAYSEVIAYAFLAIMVGAVGWAFRQRALSFNTIGLAVLAVGAVSYLALPRVMFETYMVDLRLPISLAFILIACIDIDLRNRLAQLGFVVGLLLLVAVRVGEVELTWSPLSAGVESFRQSVEMLNRGAKVAVSYADPNGGDFLSDYGLVHADCIAIIERSALVTTEFTVEGKQILHARQAYRSRVDVEDGTPPMIGTLVKVADRPDSNPQDYWRRWTQDYDYLYVLFTTPNFANPDPTHLTELYAGDRFILYRVERSQLTANSKDIR
jgi:hypothetical protein